MSKVILAYVPVIHRGYRDFFLRHPDADTLFVLGEELIAEFDPLRKEIRALRPHEVMQALEGWQLPFQIRVADRITLEAIRLEGRNMIMPDEDVCHALAETHFKGYESIVFDAVFLRWDRNNALISQPVSYDRKTPFEGALGEIMNRAFRVGEKSILSYNESIY